MTGLDVAEQAILPKASARPEGEHSEHALVRVVRQHTHDNDILRERERQPDIPNT